MYVFKWYFAHCSPIKLANIHTRNHQANLDFFIEINCTLFLLFQVKCEWELFLTGKIIYYLLVLAAGAALYFMSCLAQTEK